VGGTRTAIQVIRIATLYTVLVGLPEPTDSRHLFPACPLFHYPMTPPPLPFFHYSQAIPLAINDVHTEVGEGEERE
jgi:hypothetical protein